MPHNPFHDDTQEGLSQTSTQDTIDFVEDTQQGVDEDRISRPDFSRIAVGDIRDFDDTFIPTGGFAALERQRAIDQSTGEQIRNSAVRLLPAVGLGIIENAGYLLEVPNVIAGDKQDYSNSITEFAKRNREALEEAFPIRRESPQKVFDLTDNAWWIENGSGLVESIGEFLATGVGVGSALGKGASSVSKALNLSARGAAAAQGTAQALTAASLAYTEGAMSGAQIYQETFADAVDRGLTEEEANQLASRAASKTVALNTAINTALNITSVAPLFSRSLGKASRLKTNRLKGESVSEYKARLAEIANDPLNGFRPNTKEVLGREILQEGLEEEVNLFAEQEGRLEAGLISEQEAGGSNALDRFIKSSFTEEGALNFLLGAIGGAGQTGGIALLTREARQAELDQLESERVANVQNIRTTFDQIDEKKRELQTEASRKVANEDERVVRDQNVRSLRDELFDINQIYHFKKGTEDALIGSLEEIASIDNATDLGESLQPQIDEINQQGTDLVTERAALREQGGSTEEIDALTEQINSLRETRTSLLQEQARLSGQTEAMQQGLAEDKFDNNYKEISQQKIADINADKQRYNELSFQYNTTPESQLVDVAAQILDKEIASRRYNRNIDSLNTTLDFSKVNNNADVVNKVDDAFLNDLLLLEGRQGAITRILSGQVSPENREKLERDLEETNAKIQELKDNDQKLEGKSLDAKKKDLDNDLELIRKYSTLIEGILNNENLRDDNNRQLESIANNPNVITDELQKEIKNIERQREKADADKANQERKAQRDRDREAILSFENLIDTSQSEDQLDQILDQLDQADLTNPDLLDRISKRREQITTTVEEEVVPDTEEATQVDEVEEEVPEEINDIPDSYVEDETFTNNPTKEVVTKDRDENDLLNSAKIVEAAKSVAYRVKSFRVEDGVKTTDSNDLDPNLQRGVLVENNYKEGDEVRIEIDRDFNREIEGVQITIDSFNNDPLLLPMKIVHVETGETIGFLHDVNYMNENSVADGEQFTGNIDKQRQLISEFREKVVANGGSVSTTLDNVRGGWVISTNRVKNAEGNFLRSSTEVFKNPNLQFGVVGLTENGIQSIGSDVETRNSSEFVSNNIGKVVALLPDIKGDLLAAPISINRLDEPTIDTVANAIEIFFKSTLTDNEQKVVDDIKNLSNENIRNAKGLQSFIEKYLLVTSLNEDRSEEIRNNGVDSRRHYIGVTKDRISIQQDRRSRIDFEKGRDLSTEEVQRLRNYLGLMYFNVNDALIGDKNHIRPTLLKDDQGVFSYNQETGSYVNYIKSISRTNIHENQFTYNGETHYSYFDNPVYEIDLDVQVTKENIAPDQEVKVNENPPKKRRKTRRQQLLEDKYTDENDVVENSKDDNISQSPRVISDDNFTENDRLREALTTHLESSFTPKQLNDVINTGFGEILTEIVGGSTVQEAFEAWNEYVEDSADDHTYEYQDRFIAVRENLTEINDIIRAELTKVRTEILKTEDETLSEDGVEDKESTSEKIFSDSDAIWAEDNKFKSSERMKIFLLMISEVDVTYRKGEGNNLIVEHVPVSNYLDSVNLIPIDESFNKLKELLADTGNDFDAMMEVLRKEENNIGWLKDVRKNFNEAYVQRLGLQDIDQLKNEFVKLFSNSNFIFKTALFSRNQAGNIETQLINTDRVSSFRRTFTGWVDGIKNTNLYDNIQGSYVLNKNNAQSAINWYDKNILNNPNKDKINLINAAKSWVKVFGIDVNKATLVEILNTGKQAPLTKFTSPKGFFRIFYNELKKGINTEGGFEQNNPLINNNSAIELARKFTKNSSSIHSSSFKNGEGNTINSINQNRNITQRLSQLKDNKDYAKNLLRVPFLKPTRHYQTVLEKFSLGNARVIKGVNLSVFDTLNQRNRNIKGSPLNEQTGRELEASKIINFLDTGDFITEGDAFFNYTHLVPSKSTAFLVRLPKEKVETVGSGDPQLTVSSLNKLYSIVLSEIERINTYSRALEAEGTDIRIEGYKPDRFYFFQELNDIVDSAGNPIILNGRVELNNEIESLIKNHIQEQFTAMVNDKRALWEKYNIVREDGVDFIPSRFGTVDNINDFVIDYVYNDLLGNFNMHQLFIGDPALFTKGGINTTWDNISKRLVKDQAPGTDYARDKNNTSYIQLALQDVELDSLNVNALGDAYKDIEITDAQEFITVREGLLNLLHSGNITMDTFDRAMAQYERDGSAPDIAGLFQPQKPIYSGKRVHSTPEGVILAEVQDYVKSSAVVLTKDLTQGTPLDRLRVKMEELEREKELPVRASFKTANKLGGGRPLKIADNAGTILEDIEISPENYVLHERVNLRNQQDIPFDRNKNQTVDGSQQRKLIQYIVPSIKSNFLLEGKEMSGSEIISKYNELYNTLFKNASDNLKNDLFEEGELNIDKVSELLVEEAKSRGWSSNSIKGLEVKNSKFRLPLFFNTNSNRIESLLNSIVNNKVLTNKRTGKSYVLKSEVGVTGYARGIAYTESYDPETGLKPMRVEDGVTKPGQILVPTLLQINGQQIDIMKFATRDNDGVLKLNSERIPQSVLETFGYRIPTQGYNSMAHLEIVGFLPPELGDRVIASRDLVAQMGSDFDVDKLYLFTPETTFDSKFGFSKVTDSIDNQLLDIQFSIMSNPELFKFISQTDSTGELGVLAKKITEDTRLPRLYDSYRTNKYLESQDGAIGIGVFATLGTFLSSTSNLDNVYHYFKENDINIKVDVGFQDRKGNDISDVNTIDRKNNKLRINSFFLSASVDNDKDPILGKLNLNKFTFNAVQTLIAAGFNEGDIAQFVNQDIIRNWVERYSQLVDSSIDEFSDNAEVQATVDIIEDLQLNENVQLEEAKFADIGSSEKHKQAEQLNKFLELRNLGKNISSVKSAINTDSRGLPKSILEAITKENQARDLFEHPSILNAHKILGEYEEGKDMLPLLEEPTSISGSTIKHGLMLNNQLWKNYYSPYSQNLFRESVRLLQGISNAYTLTDDQKADIARNLKTFKAGEISSGILNGSVADERNRLLYGDNNLAVRIEQAKIDYPEDIFLKAISVEPDQDGDAPIRLFYNNISTEGLDSDYIYRAFNQRLVDPATSELIEDIIRYSLLTNFNNVPGSITNLIPVEYFEIRGISTEMDNTNWDNNEESNAFVRQFIQNNPKYARRIPRELQPETPQDSLDFGEIEDLMVDENFVPYVSYFNQGDGYILYSHSGNGVYERIGLLGYKGIKEFDITAADKVYLSSYEKNNVGVKSPEPSNQIDSFPTENKRTLNTNVKRAYISKYNTSSVSSLMSSVSENLVNPNLSDVYNLMAGYPDLETKLELKEGVDFEGQYDGNTNTITLNTTLTESRFQEVLLHEVMHSILDRIVTSDPASRNNNQVRLLNAISGVRNRLNEDLQKNTERYPRFRRKLELFDKFKQGVSDEYLRNPFTEEERDIYQSSVDQKEFIANLFTSDTLQTTLNNRKFEGDKTFLQRISEIIRKFLQSFTTLGGERVQANSDLESTIANVIELVESTTETQSDATSVSQSPIAVPAGTDQQVHAIENEFNLRNEDGSRKRFSETNFKKTRKKVVDLNKNKLDSNFRAKMIRVAGEKGDRHTYNAIQIVKNNTNKVSYSPVAETEEDRIVSVIGEFQKDNNRLKNSLNTEAKGDKEQQARIRQKIEENQAKIDALVNQKSVQNIIEFGKDQLNEIIEILDSDNISAGDLHRSENQLNLWTEIDNLILDQEALSDVNSPDLQELQEIKKQADSILTGTWLPIARNYIKDVAAKKDLGVDAIIDEFYSSEPDINLAKREALGLSRTGQDVILNRDRSVYKQTGYIVPLINNKLIDADTLATQEYKHRLKVSNDAFSKFEKSAFFKDLKKQFKNPYEFFAQKDADGKKTGFLINRISDNYFRVQEELKSKKDFMINSPDSTSDQKKDAVDNYNTWRNENNVQVDVREIFNRETLELNKKKLESYIKTLAKQIGGDKESSERRARDLIDTQTRKMESYKENLEGERLRIENLDETDADKSRLLNEFKLRHDPFLYFDNKGISQRVAGKFVNSEGYYSIASTPISKWLDSDFDKINNDDAAREFYRFFIESMNDLYRVAPDDVFRELQYNHLPYYPKSLMQKINDKGVLSSSTAIGDELLDLFREKGLDNIDNQDRDLKTGQVEFNLSFPSRKKVNFTGTEAEKEVNMENQSFDLKKIHNMYTMSVMAYKHKKAIEDDVWLARSLFNYQQELLTNNGTVILDAEGKEKTLPASESLKNKKSQLDYVINRNLLGQNPDNLVLGTLKERALTSDDKKIVKELEQQKEEVNEKYGNGEIDNVEREIRIDRIDKKIVKQGSPVTGRKVFKRFLGWVRAKGMGFNVFAAITNLNVAYISNRIHGAGGEDFTNKDLNEALSVVLNSTLNVIPSAGIGAVLGTIVAPGVGTILGAGLGTIVAPKGNLTDKGKKVSSLMQKYEVLGDITEANVDGEESKFFDNVGLFELQKKSEYFSQGMTMVAMMKNLMIKNKEGNNVPLWEAYDVNGNWKSDEFDKDTTDQWNFKDFKEGEGTKFLDFKRRLNSTLAKIHGDYARTTALKVNSSVLGQAVTMFRRWIPEGIAQRFGDVQGENDFQSYREGRWRMYTKIANIKKTLKLLVTFNKGEVDTVGWKDHEIANLKKNVAEIQMYLGVLALGLLTKAMADDDDDEYAFLSNFALNQIFRLQSDLTFYVSPSSFEDITRNAVPAFQVFNDVAKTIEYGERILFEDNATDKTTEAFWLRTTKLFPAGNGFVSTFRATEQLFDR